MFKEIADVILQVRDTSSTLGKKQILVNNRNNTKLLEVLHFIYNPYNKCCIGNAKLSKLAQTHEKRRHDLDPKHIIEYLTHYNTGTDDAVKTALDFIASVDDEYENAEITKVAIGLVTQDLSIGVSVKTLNDVYGQGFIPVVGCMLGKSFEDVKNVQWPCIITEKLDGIRRILIKENGVARMFSRSGIEDTWCVEILKDAKLLPDNYVYDGELLAEGDFKDCIALRQATNSIANSKSEKVGLTFHVFDIIPIKEFYAGCSSNNAVNRKILLGAFFNDDSIMYLDDNYAQRCIAFAMDKLPKHIKAVPILGVATRIEDVEPVVAKIWAKSGEGVMLNTASGLYEVKRSNNLLKIKHIEDITLTIVDFEEGTGKYQDSLGALIVDYKGVRVGVGSGFTDSEREYIWNHKDQFLGRNVEIETFGESTNAMGTRSLNCPIFKRMEGAE